uniref:DUF3074 domain-containing protein n=1 Tax=Schizophyllum commune (strain H4-8 / FGSC 9210) TaxID=578458 RepID=D8PSR8_SCHCM
MSDSFVLSKKPVPVTDIPSEEAIVARAKEVLASIPQWKEGKAYKGGVKTYTLPKGLTPGTSAEDFWACRVSELSPSDASFDAMWAHLAKDKAENEMKSLSLSLQTAYRPSFVSNASITRQRGVHQLELRQHRYMPIIRKVTKVEEISPAQEIWTLLYKFNPVMTPRVFTVLQLAHLDESHPTGRVGIIVQVPIDLSPDPELAKLEEKGVKASYVSVEQLTETKDGTDSGSEAGKVRWTMATSSHPGGMIPDAITNASLAGEIAKDVPNFLSFLKSVKG